MSLATLVRCHRCGKGFTSMHEPVLRCAYCGGSLWVSVYRLTWLDRWRLWRQGLSPWMPSA